jgi:20S proteasome alpha/beta subunit
VIATDKKVPSVLVDEKEYEKIQNITPSTGCILIVYVFFSSLNLNI